MMRFLSAWYENNRLCEFEPDAKMPLGEAFPLYGYDGDLITLMATEEYMIHTIKESLDHFVVRAGDRKAHTLPADTMVYVKFSDLNFERQELARQEGIIQAAKDKYKVIE